MKTIGIIGGLGPKTTAELYLQLVRLGQERKRPRERLPILISSVPLPLKLEERAIIHGQDLHRIKPLLLDSAEQLERGGAEVLILACNSLHIFIDAIRLRVKIPVLSIIDETITALRKSKTCRVGILGTGITIRSKLYEHPLRNNGVSCVYPRIRDQRRLNAAIHSVVTGAQPSSEDTVGNILEHMALSGVRCVVLACTDLKLLLRTVPPGLEVLDTLDILAQAAVREAYSERKRHPGHSR